MTPKLIEKINALISAGMTQAMIEEQTGIPQYRVSRLGSGATKNPRWSDVEKINSLYDHVITQGQHWNDFKQQTEET